MSGPLFWLVYISPTLLAWYRARHGKAVQGSLTMILMTNLFIGWTIIGWLLALASAFGRNPVAWVALRLVKVLPTGQFAGAPGGTSMSYGTSQSDIPCGSCSGRGVTPCSSCQSRGSWYDPPQGEHGVAQLRTCGACTSSGSLRCMSCGGSGRAAALL